MLVKAIAAISLLYADTPWSCRDAIETIDWRLTGVVRPEGAEMGMVHGTVFLQPSDGGEQGAVGIGGGPDHELHGHPRGAAGVDRIGGPAGGARPSGEASMPASS